MKNLFSFMLAACLLLGACQSPSMLTVKGKIDGFEPGTVITLLHSSAEEGFLPVDSAVFSSGGKFSLNVDMAKSGAYLLFIGKFDEGPQFYKEFVGEPGYTVRITGDHYAPRAWVVSSNIPEQAEWNRFEDAVRKLEHQRGKIFSRIDEIDRQPPTGEAEEKILRQEEDSLRRLRDLLQWQRDSITLEVVIQNPNTDKALNNLAEIASIMGFDQRVDALRPRIEEAYGLLTPEQQESPNGRDIYAALFLPQVEDGAPLADTDLVDLQGTTHRLADYAGKYLLLDFWASWCGPCIETFPELRAFAEKNADEVTVIGIDVDENPEDWARATEKHGVTWVNLHVDPESTFPRQYGVVGIPHTVLVSPEGIVLRNGWHYQRGNLDSEFQSLF
jgi:thiol-disulfide isomerase/thioredoxin